MHSHADLYSDTFAALFEFLLLYAFGLSPTFFLCNKILPPDMWLNSLSGARTDRTRLLIMKGA